MIVRLLCWLLAVVLGCAAPCRAEESSGATLMRKCDTYLYGAGGRLASEQAAKEAADCASFIDAVVAAARLAHEHRGLLPPPGKVDEKAYRAFAMSFRWGVDSCLPSGLATHEVARQLRLMVSLNRELLWTDALTTLRFVLAELYPCTGASP
jgi:hypothetical protein